MEIYIFAPRPLSKRREWEGEKRNWDAGFSTWEEKKSYVPVSFLQIGSQNPEMRKEKKEEFSQKFSQFKREKIAPISSSNSPTPRDEKSYLKKVEAK